MLPVVIVEDSRLQKECDLITHFGEPLQKLVDEMNETMIHANGIGLAAPQIGKNIRLIIVKRGEEGSDYHAYANPVITFYSNAKTSIEEGCLSVPGTYGFVERATKVRFTYQDMEGHKHRQKATGMQAIILQHEVDHINGILIIDKDIHVTRAAKAAKKSQY